MLSRHATAATVLLLTLLYSLPAYAQSIQVNTAADPTRVRPGDAFHFTVVVTQWVPGTSNVPEPTIQWPDWNALGIVSASEASRSNTSMPMGNQAMGVTSIVLSLKTGEAGTIEIPAIAVKGSAGEATTNPLTINVDSNASPPAPAPAPAAAPPQAPQAPMPPAPTGSLPWWQDPAITQPQNPPAPPQTTEEGPMERLQYGVGAFAFLVAVIFVVWKLSRSGRR